MTNMITKITTMKKRLFNYWSLRTPRIRKEAETEELTLWWIFIENSEESCYEGKYVCFY